MLRCVLIHFSHCILSILFTRFGTVQFLAFPHSQNDHKWETFNQLRTSNRHCIFWSYCMAKSGVPGSYDNAKLNNLNTARFFSGSGTILHSYKQRMGVPIPPYPHYTFFIHLFCYYYSYPRGHEVVAHYGFH